MCGFEADKEMHMIRDPTDTLRNPAQTPDCTAEVFVKTRPPFRRDHRLAAFRREDDVVKEVGVRRGHGGGGWHPIRGARSYWIRYPVVSLRSTIGYKLKSLRLENLMPSIKRFEHPGRDDSL